MANVFQIRKEEVKQILATTDPWEWCTHEGARRHTLYQGFFSTFKEKIVDLESMEDLSLMFRKSRLQSENRHQQPVISNQPSVDSGGRLLDH